MKKLSLILIALSLVTFTVQAQQSETRNVENFHAVDAGGSFSVYLKKGNTQKVVIEGESSNVERIITEVRNGTLKIYAKSGSWKSSIHKTKVYVTFTKLDGLSGSGSGSTRLESSVSGSDFKLSSSGSGSLHCEDLLSFSGKVKISNSGSGSVNVEEIKADDLSVSNSGSGSLRIHDGSTDYQSINCNGSGSVKMEGVASNVCNINKTGSGSVYVYVIKELNGSSTGSGNVVVKGSDAKMNFNSTGSGKLRTVN